MATCSHCGGTGRVVNFTSDSPCPKCRIEIVMRNTTTGEVIQQVDYSAQYLYDKRADIISRALGIFLRGFLKKGFFSKKDAKHFFG